MIGPALALACFCALLAWAAVERRAVERAELQALFDEWRRARFDPLAAGQAFAGFAAVMTDLGRAAMAAARAQEQFNVAWREAEARDEAATARFLRG